MLIAFTGAAGAGKDTAAASLFRHGMFQQFSFADTIKDGLNAMFAFKPEDWQNRKWKEDTLPRLGKSPRELAQTLGTEWGREIVHPNVWVRAIEMRIAADQRCNSGEIFVPVITDLRFENEAEWVKERNGIIIKIARPDNDVTTLYSDHKSEAGVPEQYIDTTFINNATPEELQHEVWLYVHKRLVEG